MNCVLWVVAYNEYGAALVGSPASGRRHGSGGIGLHGCRVYTWSWGWQIPDSRIGGGICDEDAGAVCEEP